MIKITMFKEKWRVTIGDEVWEFPDLRTMIDELETICEIKEKYGRIYVNPTGPA